MSTPFGDPVLPGFRPDPSVCRVGADYYLATSSFAWFPGLPVFHSRDLVNRRRRGSALDRPSQLDLDGCEPSRGLFAPTIRHEAAGRTEIWRREYLPRERRLTGPEYVLWSGSRPGARWPEAPHLYRIDGTCLLLTAEGGPDVDHSVVAARADHVTGPYEGAPGNPVLPPATGPVTRTGHADLVQTPDGDWRAVLLGVRPGSAVGRETFLSRVTWSDGWPVFSPCRPHRPSAPSPRRLRRPLRRLEHTAHPTPPRCALRGAHS
ncbi:family 43 glycosylhydrolase [Streptomyces sp. NPDC047928]|uniref:family 43 glycosylhydrolase n=1 Tax=unclassified Streptomyces TaxID=2593676 RepID=UPI00371A55A0